MKNPVLKNSRGMFESLSNLIGFNRNTITQIEDAVEDSKTGVELVNKLNSLDLLRKFVLDRETDTKVRLKSTDYCGNVSYFEATKERKIEKEKQLAMTITDAINGSFNSKEFCEAMSREHRTLQADFTDLCLKWFEKCAEMYDNDRYDGRNEYSCKMSKMIMDFINNL